MTQSALTAKTIQIGDTIEYRESHLDHWKHGLNVSTQDDLQKAQHWIEHPLGKLYRIIRVIADTTP